MSAFEGEFSYVFIPADTNFAVEQLKASKKGGLTDDALRCEAERRFGSAGIDKSRQRNAIAAQMKEKGMPADAIASSLNDFGESFSSGNVEIITLCLPTEESKFQSVSLYCDGNSSFRSDGSNRPNTRATALADACGYKDMIIMGDCFIGMAHDDERVEWERLDFTTNHMKSDAPWVVMAARLNKGKDMSKWSTSGALQGMGQQPSGASGSGIQGKGLKVTANAATPVIEEVDHNTGFNFKEDEDDVEIRFKLPAASLLPSKNLLVVIKTKSIVIGLKSVSKTEGSAIEGVHAAFTNNGAKGGSLQGEVSPESSVWSVDNERGGRWLTITLAKKGKYTWGRCLLKKQP